MKHFRLSSVLSGAVLSATFALAAPYTLAGDKDHDSQRQGMENQQSEHMDREEQMRREREGTTSPGAPNEMNTGPDGTGSGTSATGHGNGPGTGTMGNEGAGTGSATGSAGGAGGN